MLLEGMNMPINRREFGRIFLGALSMYALGAPKNAKAVEEGEPSYYFNQFNTDIFPPFRTSGITPSDVQARWGRYGNNTAAFIENGDLRFSGQGGVRVALYNGPSLEKYDIQASPLDLSARFTIAGEYLPNNDNKSLEFGFRTGPNLLSYTIIPGENPFIIFKDMVDTSFENIQIPLQAQTSYTPRIRSDGEKVIASLKQDTVEQIIVEKPLSDIWGSINFDADGGSPSSPYDFKADWLLIKGSQVNPEGSDQLSRADLNLDAEVDSIDAHLFADKFARGEANQSDLLVFIEEFQRRNPEDQATLAVLQALRTSSVEDWGMYR